MVLFNYSTRELTAKIVYYGPGLCGKTTNLQFVYDSLPDEKKGRMLSLSTQTDRTLYFDFLPVELGDIRGMKTRVQLYTVPGQVFYNETRRMVLKGVDGVVFVADSQKRMADANLESFRNLEANLEAHGLRLADLPLVLQFNKRDLPDTQSIEEMNAALNIYNAPFYEAVATTGIGVHDTLKAVSKLVLRTLSQKYESGLAGREDDLPDLPGPSDAVAAGTAGPEAAARDLQAAPPGMAAGDDWESGDLEGQLDTMNLDEIQGLLEEVDGMSESGAEPAPAAAVQQQAPETTAASLDAGEDGGLFQSPLADEPPDDEPAVFTPEAKSVDEEDDGSVWLGLPPDQEAEALPGADLSAGNETEPAREDEEAAVPASAGSEPASDDSASRLSFESFLQTEQDAPIVQEEPVDTDEPVDDMESSWHDIAPGPETGEQAAAPPEPAAEMSDGGPRLAAADDGPALAPGTPEDMGNGHLRLPLRLELNGRQYTYILTLSLQPETGSHS